MSIGPSARTVWIPKAKPSARYAVQQIAEAPRGDDGGQQAARLDASAAGRFKRVSGSLSFIAISIAPRSHVAQALSRTAQH